MSKAKTLQDLFHDTLKDIYYAEKKILGALPKMAKAAQSEDLRAAFELHLEETEGQVERLEAVFEEIEARPQGKTCDAIVGIIDEGKEIMSEYKGAPALDAGLLAAAQAVEHYEISRYGTLITWADELGLTNASKLLKETLAEEKKTDESLTELAKRVVNAEAVAVLLLRQWLEPRALIKAVANGHDGLLWFTDAQPEQVRRVSRSRYTGP
jgi:ferritin-like metal-binding protein YciE